MTTPNPIDRAPERFANLACIQTDLGFVICDRETKWRYTKPEPSEAEAWQAFEKYCFDVGHGIKALLQTCSSVTIQLEQAPLKTVGRPKNPKKGIKP